MSEPAATRDPIGPGRLVLVVGPSGAGKDTLIDLARSALCDDTEVVFVRRVVTRQASKAENNIQISTDAFIAGRDAGRFAVCWEAHGLHYALPIAIDHDIRAGRCVVANGSRTVIDLVRATYADSVVIEITAPPDVLTARLAARGRASDGPIGKRLGRNVAAVKADKVIVNVGNAEDHAHDLVAAILSGRTTSRSKSRQLDLKNTS